MEEPLARCPNCGRDLPAAILAECDPPLCRRCRFRAERHPARRRRRPDDQAPAAAVPPVGEPGASWAALLPGWLFGQRWEGCSLEILGRALPPDAPRVGWQLTVGAARVQTDCAPRPRRREALARVVRPASGQAHPPAAGRLPAGG